MQVFLNYSSTSHAKLIFPLRQYSFDKLPLKFLCKLNHTESYKSLQFYPAYLSTIKLPAHAKEVSQDGTFELGPEVWDKQCVKVSYLKKKKNRSDPPFFSDESCLLEPKQRDISRRRKKTNSIHNLLKSFRHSFLRFSFLKNFFLFFCYYYY